MHVVQTKFHYLLLIAVLISLADNWLIWTLENRIRPFQWKRLLSLACLSLEVIWNLQTTDQSVFCLHCRLSVEDFITLT